MPHRGVAVSDPRNACVLAFLQPRDFSDEAVVRARLMRFMTNASPEKVDAAVARIMAAPNPPVPISQPVDAITSPFGGGLGTHPDLIERLWHLDATLPERCRWVVHGSPALVHPVSGVIFGFAQGTLGYALRLPPGAQAEADRQRPLPKTAHLVGGEVWDLAQAGPEWRLGTGSAAEAAWCRAAFDAAEFDRRS